MSSRLYGLHTHPPPGAQCQRPSVIGHADVRDEPTAPASDEPPDRDDLRDAVVERSAENRRKKKEQEANLLLELLVFSRAAPTPRGAS
jgi:hypothetical protein